MVRIRLRRVGGKKQPSFRIVAADKESPRDGRFIEVLGFYNPRTEPATIQLNEERIYDWMSKGAQTSDSAQQVFKVAGLVDRYERFKSGEKLEKLLGEAEEAAKQRNVNSKTRHEPPVGKPKKKDKPEAEPKAAVDEQEATAEAEGQPADKEEESQPKAEAKETDASADSETQEASTEDDEPEVVAEAESEKLEEEQSPAEIEGENGATEDEGDKK